MVQFLGYDPGGGGKHGVALTDIDEEGSFATEPTVDVLADAGEVREWLRQNSSAKALGIDTLLAWSIKGKRACDIGLRERYPTWADSIIHQNSLYSAMTINGILVAETGHELGMQLVESHPKLLIDAALAKDPAGTWLALRHRDMLATASSKADQEDADNMADALVAAWSASRWWFKRWSVNIYAAFPNELIYPAGSAVYPWPEAIGSA